MGSRLSVLAVSVLVACAGSPLGGPAGDGDGGDGDGDGDGGGGAAPDATPPGPPAMCEVTIDCGGVEIPDDPKATCSIRIDDGSGATLHDGAVGIELRGRSSSRFPKAQYSIELRTAAGEDAPADLLGMGREADWILNGMWIDRALLRNKLVYDMFQGLGGAERFAPQSAYCTLTLDGDPRGIYVLSERVERDDDRVAIADDGGVGASFILKQDDGGGFRPIGIANGQWQLVYPRAATVTAAQTDGVAAWLQGLEDAVNGLAPDVDLFDLVDLGNAVDFVLFEELLKNVDAYYLSMHVWKDVGGQLHFTPWDVDLSFGQPLYGTGDDPEGWIQGRPALIAALAADARFQDAIATRWAELRGSIFTVEAIEARVASYLATFGPHVDANFARWPIDEVEFGVEWTGTNQLYPVSSHAEELGLISTWLELRLAWIDEHIDSYAD